MKWSYQNGCDFCCYAENDVKGRQRRYAKEDDGYAFFAGYSKQVDVDAFDDHEIENLRYCPMCARKMEESQ